MKSFVFGFAVLALIVVCYGIPDEDHYTDKYDKVKLDDVLSNRRLLQNYFDCIMERGKCTPDGEELRSHIKEALQNRCSKCTDAQKKGVEKVIKHLIEHENPWWNELCEKYDPEGKYRKEYEEDAKKHGVKV